MSFKGTMKRIPYLFLLVIFMLSACNLPEVQATKTAAAQTATAAMRTVTSLPSTTFTSTYTATIAFTLTSTPIPTNTYTPTITPTPTFAFPKVTVNVDNLACKFGPAKAYLWARDLHLGDTGFVWGRAPVGEWLYVKMDRLDIPCWIHPFYVDLVGDIKTVAVQDIWLPMTNDLYSAPKNVEAVRDGDQVTVTWDDVYMTQDDDRGYFLDVWVCQDGNYIWMPTSLPDQYQTSATFTDQPGCSEPSGGKLYTVEKHGYPDPVDIPWPPYD
jgi:hypothetical protein